MAEKGTCSTCGAENVELDPTTEQCYDCVEEGAPEAGKDAEGSGILDEFNYDEWN